MAEYEKDKGLPEYTVYPEAKEASYLTDKGYFMYRVATPDERAAMTKGQFMKIKTKTPEQIQEEKTAKRNQDNDRYAARKNERIS